MKQGDPAIFKGEMKSLDKGTQGIISHVGNGWATITYPQNSAYDYSETGWKPKPNAPNKVYSHSAQLNEIEFI